MSLRAPRFLAPAAVLVLAACTLRDTTSPRSRAGEEKLVRLTTTMSVIQSDGSREVVPGYPYTREARLVHDGKQFVVQPLDTDVVQPGTFSLASEQVRVEMPVLSIWAPSGGAGYQENELVGTADLEGSRLLGVRGAEGAGPLTDLASHDGKGNITFAMHMDWQRDGDAWIMRSGAVRLPVDLTAADHDGASAILEVRTSLSENLADAGDVEKGIDAIRVLSVLARLGRRMVQPTALNAQAPSPADQYFCDRFKNRVADDGCRAWALNETANILGVSSALGVAARAKDAFNLPQTLRGIESVLKGRMVHHAYLQELGLLGRAVSTGVAYAEPLAPFYGVVTSLATADLALLAFVGVATVSIGVYAQQLASCPKRDVQYCRDKGLIGRGSRGGGGGGGGYGGMGDACSVTCTGESLRVLMKDFWGVAQS